MSATFNDLKDKTILITGATRGIGKTIATVLATQGANVVFNFREGKEDQANELKEELLQKGAKSVHALLFDITDTKQTKAAIDEFTKDIGPIHGLVNNAGISKDQLMLRLKEEDLDAILNTNLKGAMMLTQALTRNFLKAPEASIVNMSSIVGLMGNSAQSAYAASKAGLLGFTKSYAKELAGKGVRCNAVCPGFIETDMTQTLDDKVKEAYLSGIPLKRFGTTEEVANLTCFLLSSTSSYMTGEILKIDGGLYI
jgi:3-oxoacyl-[acyl-carrier protein] reductase